MCAAIGLSSRPAGCPRGRFYVWVFSFASTDRRRPLTFGVALQNHGRHFFTQSVVGEGPLSFPPPQYRETIAPSIPPRHHCQDAPNRFFGRCPSLPWVETRMATINRQELDRLERRELQLTIMAAVFVFVLASGLAVFMYPLVFFHPDYANRWTLRVAFFGFCALTLLFIAYLLERHNTVRTP